MRLSCGFFFPSAGLQLFAFLCSTIASLNDGMLTVTTIADSGPGSLRQALADAAENGIIQFDTSLNGQTINLTSGELVIDKSIVISGPGLDSLVVARASTAIRFRIFHVLIGHTVTIEGLTISGGYADASFGAGILNEQSTLTIHDCAVSENVSDSGAGGGGIYNTGTLIISDSIVSFNRAGFTIGHSPVGYGGGIRSGGKLVITNSTISDNTADFNGGGIDGFGTMMIVNSTVSGNHAGTNLSGSGFGGGIYNHGMLEISNSTVSGNSASGDGSGDGGGILSNAPLKITNSTLSGNLATVGGGGISNYGALEIGNTILKTGPIGANIFSDTGTVTSLGYNLCSDDCGGFLTTIGDQVDTDPILGPLQNNGGQTLTHALLTGSPAINAGDPKFTPPPVTDQRGFLRVFDGRIDVGSVEMQPVPTPSPTPTATATATMSPTATPTITQTPSATASPTPSPVKALNISTRLRVEPGDRVMIGGFIVTGSPPKDVVLRGIGPSLAGSGISDPLADPILELRDGSGGLVFQNDNWQDDSGQATQLIALGLAPPDPNESGIVAALPPGAGYTAILAGKNGGTGVGLVEVYDTNQSANSQLANISTRGFVQTGDNVMIGGFILGGGNGNTPVAVRGIGPSLTQIGLTDVLADPTLELRDSNGALLVFNDNWQEDAASASQLAAHGLALQNPLESGIFTSLTPGAFTAILAGTNSGTGIGLIEIYNVGGN